MKSLMIPFFYLIISLIVFSCSSQKGSNREQNMTFICPGVLGKQAMSDTFVFEKSKTRSLSAELSAAAHADAIRSADSLSGSGSVKLSGALATTWKTNIKSSTTVSEDFWQEQFYFARTLCFYEHLRKDKSLSKEDRDAAYRDERDFLKSMNIYESNVKKKAQN